MIPLTGGASWRVISQLPSYVFLTAFVTACVGEAPDEMSRWVTAWRHIRLAAEEVTGETAGE